MCSTFSGRSRPLAKVGARFCFTCPVGFSCFCHFFFFYSKKGAHTGPSPRSATDISLQLKNTSKFKTNKAQFIRQRSSGGEGWGGKKATLWPYPYLHYCLKKLLFLAIKCSFFFPKLTYKTENNKYLLVSNKHQVYKVI